MAGLTKRLIDASAPQDGKEIRLWDDDPRGFGIRIKPSGVKTFFVQYRSPVTFKKARLTIGQYGRLTRDEAQPRPASASDHQWGQHQTSLPRAPHTDFGAAHYVII